MDNRYARHLNRFDRLVAELGVGLGQFNFDVARFDLSSREWLEVRLRALGWMRREEVVELKCERECCG